MMLTFSRGHFGIRGSGAKHRTTRMFLEIGGESRSIALADHPGIVTMFVFNPPRILVDFPGMQDVKSGIISRVFVNSKRGEDIVNSGLAQPGGIGLVPSNRMFKKETFARMLAKIGHAHATARGVPFTPFLCDIVRGVNCKNIYDYIGTMYMHSDNTSDLHYVETTVVAHKAQSFVVTHIQLFAMLDFPVHTVVVGAIG